MRAVELEHTVPTVGWVRDPVESAAGPLLKEQGFDTFYVPMYKRGDPTFCRQVLEEAPRAGRMQAARVLPLLEQHGISRRRLRDLKLGLPIMLPDGRERVDKTTPTPCSTCSDSLQHPAACDSLQHPPFLPRQ